MSTEMSKREDQRPERVAERPTVAPRVDVFENKDELLLIAALPGVAEANLKIHLDEEELTIEGRPDEERTSSGTSTIAGASSCRRRSIGTGSMPS
jgi:HSP20 family molecular chaperone IbpA